MKKLAVIFPGVGYICAKPLLYYTAAMAEEYGYETIRLDYGKDIHSFKGRTPDALKPVTQLALSRVMPALLDLPAASYEEVLFISKSIGTVIACQAEKELTLSRPVRHFLMTPIPATLPYLNNIEGIFFSGTADPYISSEQVREAALTHPEKTGIIFEGCNHSLEKKLDTLGNLDRLRQILDCLSSMLAG